MVIKLLKFPVKLSPTAIDEPEAAELSGAAKTSAASNRPLLVLVAILLLSAGRYGNVVLFLSGPVSGYNYRQSYPAASRGDRRAISGADPG